MVMPLTYTTSSNSSIEQGLSTGKAIRLYYPNGTLSNAYLIVNPDIYPISKEMVPLSIIFGQQINVTMPFLIAFIAYTPNKNGTITNMPSQFYNSTFYKGFFLGKLNGFTMVYPSNFTGVNYINTTAPIVIFKYDYYNGSLPKIEPKPKGINNNYIVPG